MHLLSEIRDGVSAVWPAHRVIAVNYSALRSKFAGTYIANNGYVLERAQTAIRNGTADLIAFDVPFLGNPGLVRRYQEGLPLNEADAATFYGGGETGYTDYLSYDQEQAG